MYPVQVVGGGGNRSLTVTWDLLHLVVLEHIAAIDGLELQIPRHLGVQQDLHQLAARHDELGDQVHIPI